ncbi:hypothetical protein [Myceligenerans xiligouense]|uniref:hypothetical protein n=1 Tax=Myceligenerans xiligouense TaxID=253184 RepID=UPI000F4E474E|nr:hypothetical protein [Myceligenerans xiligouense]
MENRPLAIGVLMSLLLLSACGRSVDAIEPADVLGIWNCSPGGVIEVREDGSFVAEGLSLDLARKIYPGELYGEMDRSGTADEVGGRGAWWIPVGDTDLGHFQLFRLNFESGDLEHVDIVPALLGESRGGQQFIRLENVDVTEKIDCFRSPGQGE